MPLIEGYRDASPSAGAFSSPVRRQSQLSDMAKSAIMTSASSSPSSDDIPSFDHPDLPHKSTSMMGPPKTVPTRSIANQLHKENKPPPSQHFLNPTNGIGHALNDTPVSTAPSSPQMQAPQSLNLGRMCADVLQSSTRQQNRDAQDTCHHTRHTRPHEVKGLSRRKNCTT